MEKIKLLLYCTKSKPYLLRDAFCGFLTEKNFEVYDDNEKKEDYFLNGKIVAECDFEVEEIKWYPDSNDLYDWIGYETPTLNDEELGDKSCLEYDEMEDYLGYNNGYAIHIKNLNIFDKAKELKNSGYKVRDRKNDKKMQIFKVDEWQPIAFKYIEKAPQNMCKVYRLNDNEEEYDEYILISIRPEWLVKILNGEKQIEVRRKVLKEMIK